MSLENVDLKAATIIDVRSPGEFAGGNVDSSINIPMDEIVDRIEELREIVGEIILCCLSGARSGQVTGYLQQNGFENVRNGGGWQMLAMQTI